MRSNQHILPLIFVFLALMYTLWFVFAGFGNHLDPLYWLYKYEHLEGGWMAVGTLLTGGSIVRIFGAELLSLRLAGWLTVVTAILLPYCTLLNREERRKNLIWLAFTFLLMGYGAYQEFSPGTLSVLLLSAIWVTVVLSREKSTIQFPMSILTAVLAGLAVSARFPNILVLPVLIPIWNKRSLWCVPIATITAGIVYLTGYFCITPAPMDAAMSSHDLMEMLSKLWENSGKLIGYMLMAVGVVAFPLRQKRYMGWLVGLGLALVVLYTTKPHQWYNIDLTYLLSAWCIVIALLRQKNDPFSIGAIILMIATLGTDTAWLKLFPAVLCLLPIALSQYTEIADRRYFIGVLTVLSAVVVFRMTTNSISQSDLTKATTFASISPYRGIAIRESEQNRLAQYKSDYDSLHTQNSILAIGQEMHLMRAVTGCEAAKYNEFWSNIFDSVYTAKYEPVIETERPVVFCAFSPMFKTRPLKDKESRMEKMFRAHGYREIDRSDYKYMIYIPQENEKMRKYENE